MRWTKVFVVVSFAGAASLTAAPPASAAVACGPFDTDHGTVVEASAGNVAGYWYNCSGNAEHDHVYMDVNNASDSPCYTVPWRVGDSFNYDPTFWIAFVNHSVTWRRC